MNVIARVNERPAGLLWGEESTPVPLEGVKVHAEVFGHGSRVTVAQRYRNTETVPVEAVYVFPAPEGAAVCGLVMRVGDRRIEAEVQERDQAFETYDEAMAAGHGAVLLDAERPNVFTISVGNILPGQEVVIELTWVSELHMEGDAIRFLLPTTVAPRYAPKEDREGVSPTRAESVSPPVELSVPYGLDLAVDVSLASAVRALDSPSHPVRIEIDGTRARVTLSQAAAAMDRDFVLLVTPAESGRPQAMVERNADGLATAAVSFVPRLPSSEARSEVIFLVDRSGSMAGESIAQVRAALQLCLRSLRDGDRFNIVGFGSTFGALFPGSVVYGQDTLEQASRHVDGLDADMGGTEILPALGMVLSQEPAAGLARQVVVLTDGEVSNEAAVIELAERHRARTRIFTFGIGSGASEYLVRSLARVTRGEAEFIHPGERIEPKVLRQFARLATPAVLDVEVACDGAEAALRAPHRAPAIFNGEAGITYVRFPADRDVTIRLSGTIDAKPVSWSVPVTVGGAGEGALLATLAARAAIRDLEEGTSALHDKPGGSARQGRRDERVKHEIVRIALAWHLASRETSFVAVERREAAGDRPAAVLRRVPVALAKGWGGIVARAALQPLAAAAVSMTGLDFSTGVFNVRASLPRVGAAGGWRARVQGLPPDAGEPVPEAAAQTARPAEPAHVTLAKMQRADGSWLLLDPLARAIVVDLGDLRHLAEMIDGLVQSRSLVATLAALRFLETRAADARDEWRLLAEKAERWVEAELRSRPAGTREQIESQLARLVP